MERRRDIEGVGRTVRRRGIRPSQEVHTLAKAKARSKGRARRTDAGRRWWLLPVGIAVALLALLALVRGTPSPMPEAAGPPPMDHIDEASRERLEAVLREADREAREP